MIIQRTIALGISSIICFIAGLVYGNSNNIEPLVNPIYNLGWGILYGSILSLLFDEK